MIFLAKYCWLFFALSMPIASYAGEPQTPQRFMDLVKERDLDKFNEQGYRIAFYRTRIPGPPDGVVPLSDEQFQKIVAQSEKQEGAQCPLALLDVSPDRNAVFFAGEKGEAGEWITSANYQTIANSLWLLNVGFGELEVGVENYFIRALKQITKGQASCPLVFFCIGDCWMAWNASRRALRLGYTNIYWYNNGIDGWKRLNGKLQTAKAYVVKPD